MELVEWNDSFSVGNILMDMHHRIFFETIKEFSKFADKNNHDAIKRRIEFLIEYAAMHLGAEEKTDAASLTIRNLTTTRQSTMRLSRSLLSIKSLLIKTQPQLAPIVS